MNRLCKVVWYALVALALTAPAVVRAEDPKPPAPPTPAELDVRLKIMESYFNNVDPTAVLRTGDVDPASGATTYPGKTDEEKGKALEQAKKDFPQAFAPGPGHNGWMMTCAALVLFMTLPGLALFYGGLVRRKNVLSVCAQCLLLSGLVTILWWAFGYSLVFGTSYNSAYLGGNEFFFLKGVDSAPNTTYSAWVSQNVFCMYQLMFAIITPALIVGAIAERMKFSAILVFMTAWMFLVYFPMAHMVWGGTGLMNGVFNSGAKLPAMDFAGGTVVHMTSGWSALILCLIVGPRLGFGKEKMAPHSMVLCMVGTGMLWVGWYGFNAGSAVAADGISSNAFMTTTLAAATAGFVWAMVEWLHKGHASILGFCSGIVAGLVVITPACGFVNPTGAMIIGLLAALVPYFAVVFLKGWLGYDDALDTFGVHAVGGTLGALLTGILADPAVNANIGVTDPANYATANGLAKAVAGHTAAFGQIKAILLTLVISIVATTVLGYILKFTIGLRPTSEVESAGLDISEHSEEGYIL